MICEDFVLLTIDIGNTNLKFGLWDGQAWVTIQRIRTQADLLSDYLVPFESINAVAISSVVPSLTADVIALCSDRFQIEPLLFTPDLHTGLQIALDFPQQVGTDRMLNAVAAAMLYGTPVIAVDLGTATKFDVVDSGNVYRGGAIAPGIGVSGKALSTRIARLPEVEFAAAPSVIGTNTVSAIQSGLVWGTVAMVEGMMARLKAEIGEAKVVATGGLASVIQPHLSVFDVVNPTLTLDGLRIIHAMNAVHAT
jgi:type III pantothenate kinase